MSAVAPAILAEAVQIVSDKFAASEPKTSFQGLRARLIAETHKRRVAFIGGKLGATLGYQCASDWCRVFIAFLDQPHMLRDLARLNRAVDSLERGSNPTVTEVFNQ